jgi:phytoene dehydrogenase-like protein
MDLVVVGGGIAGLAAAIFGAGAGMRVVVLERAEEVGGRARTTERGGFRLNLGPRALYRPAARVLEELGVPYTGGRPVLTGYALAGGRLHAMSRGIGGLLDGPPFEGREGAAAARALTDLMQAEAGDISHVSLAGWADMVGPGDRARQYVYALVRLASYIDAPDRLSAATAQSHLAETGGEVSYLDGGWQTIVDGLRRMAQAAGVEVQRGERAAALSGDARGVTGVVLGDGTRLATRKVVLAVDPGTARALLAPVGATVRPTTPVRAAVLDLALERLPNPEGRFVMSLDRPLYLSVHSLAARLAPGDGAVVHVARYLHPGESPDSARVREELEWLMDEVQPGWRGVVEHQRFLPDMTVMHALPEAETGGLAGRPAVAVAEAPGVYLAGDWVGVEHLLAGAALASARRAAELASGTTDGVAAGRAARARR